MAHELLNVCLVDGDSEQRQRERKIRRRALAISISLQATALAAILLMPLLGKPATMSTPIFVPIPKYYSHPPQPHVPVAQTVHPLARPTGFYAPRRIPRQINTNPQPPAPIGETVPFEGEGINILGAVQIDERAGSQIGRAHV